MGFGHGAGCIVFTHSARFPTNRFIHTFLCDNNGAGPLRDAVIIILVINLFNM